MSAQRKAQPRVTDQVPLLLSTEADARKRRVNGPELALWIIGIVLLTGSAVSVYGFIQFILAQSANTAAQESLGLYVAWTEASTLYTPGLVMAGIVCIALALFMRGLDINARRREARLVSASSPGAPIPPLTEPAATPTPVPAPAVQSRPVTDYSAFMRPSDEPADRTK